MKPLKIGFISLLFLALSASYSFACTVSINTSSLNVGQTITLTGSYSSSPASSVEDTDTADDGNGHFNIVYNFSHTITGCASQSGNGGGENFSCSPSVTSGTYITEIHGVSAGTGKFDWIDSNGFCQSSNITVNPAPTSTPTPIPPTATPTQSPLYHLKPTDQAAVNTMSAGATSSFLDLFINNWPIIATFGITIFGFFYIWKLLMGMLKKKDDQEFLDYRIKYASADRETGNITDVFSGKEYSTQADFEAETNSIGYSKHGQYINGNLIGFKFEKN